MHVFDATVFLLCMSTSSFLKERPTPQESKHVESTQIHISKKGNEERKKESSLLPVSTGKMYPRNYVVIPTGPSFVMSKHYINLFSK